MRGRVRPIREDRICNVDCVVDHVDSFAIVFFGLGRMPVVFGASHVGQMLYSVDADHAVGPAHENNVSHEFVPFGREVPKSSGPAHDEDRALVALEHLTQLYKLRTNVA